MSEETPQETLQKSPQAERKREERAEIAQILLNRPWVLKSDDPVLFAKVREHYEPLRQWFRQTCGFTLFSTNEMIKLEEVKSKLKLSGHHFDETVYPHRLSLKEP